MSHNPDLERHIERMTALAVDPDPRALIALPLADMHAVLACRMEWARLMLVLSVRLEAGRQERAQ